MGSVKFGRQVYECPSRDYTQSRVSVMQAPGDIHTTPSPGSPESSGFTNEIVDEGGVEDARGNRGKG